MGKRRKRRKETERQNTTMSATDSNPLSQSSGRVVLGVIIDTGDKARERSPKTYDSDVHVHVQISKCQGQSKIKVQL